MIGGGAADDAAADDDDLGVGGEGHRARSETSVEGGEAGIEAGEVFGGVGGIVGAGGVEVDDRDQRPQGLAQQRRALHRGVAAQELVAGGGAEIGGEEGAGLGGVEAGIGGEIGEIEHGGAEAGIFVVDQPETLAVVDEIGGQQVVVAEGDGQRRSGRLRVRR